MFIFFVSNRRQKVEGAQVRRGNYINVIMIVKGWKRYFCWLVLQIQMT